MLLLLANDAGLAITAHRACFLKSEGVQQSSLIKLFEMLLHYLPDILNWFEALSVECHTVCESLLHLFLFFILSHGLIELHLVHLFDLWVSDLHPAQ